MEFLTQFIDLFIHLDQHLKQVTIDYGTWIYAILFLIIFCETGLVVTPILPGDSLLFAAGALCAIGQINIWVLFILLSSAAILGDMVNYSIGKFLGLKTFKENSKFFKPKYLEQTHAFYERYGGKTIVIARFVPIVRTFAPFVAGASQMTYSKFSSYNIVGALLWVSTMLASGYIFGNIRWVKENFSAVVLMIIFISIIPMLIEIYKNYDAKKRKSKESSLSK